MNYLPSKCSWFLEDTKVCGTSGGMGTSPWHWGGEDTAINSFVGEGDWPGVSLLMAGVWN